MNTPEKVVIASAPEVAKKEKAPKKEKAEKAPKKEKAAKATEPAEVSEPAEAAEPVEPAEAATDAQAAVCSVASKLGELEEMFQKIAGIISGAKGKFKAFEKLVNREIKAAKKPKKSGNHSPTGFIRPCQLSPELADFLGVSHETEMTRLAAYKEIVKYIKDNSLQNAANGRKVVPDEKLTAVLKLTPENAATLTYFSIQKFIKQHLTEVKAAAVVADAPCETCDL